MNGLVAWCFFSSETFYLVEISSFDLQVIDYNLNYTVANEMFITASLVFGVYKTVY